MPLHGDDGQSGMLDAFDDVIAGAADGQQIFARPVEGLMMGVGKTRPPFVYNITGMWCIRIVGTLICTRFLGMGLISAWACMIAHNMLLFVLYLLTYLKGSWNPLNAKA